MSNSNSPYQGRKHKLHSDTDAPPKSMKRVRLESMLERLSLRSDGESPQRKATFQINPLLESTEPRPKKRRMVDLDDLISEKMASAYKDHILQGLILIRFCHPLTILVRHFQLWVKRLFNGFVRKYNERNKGARCMRPFRDFSRIIALTRDLSLAFTFQDLLNIVLEENALELQRLVLKKDKKLDSEKLQEIKDEEEMARESSYTYWDRVSALTGDVDMDEYGGEFPPRHGMERDSFTRS
ncbi:hypothetical protein JCM33374_g4118 [Metschnikowia sp. JCM 33374]|nr:hypothetical protein JCM33374_g4118 [Metschnikowia sp. JCM 33374]